MPTNRETEKEDVAHTYDGTLLSCEEGWNQPLGATWMDPEMTVLSEASQTQKDRYHMTSLTHGIQFKNDTYPQWTYLQSRNRLQFSSVQSLSRVWLFATPWIAAHQASLSIINSQSSLKLMSLEAVMPSSHLILCRLFLLLAPIPPSIRVFSNESALRMKWPKYWSFSFSISPSNEHPGTISFRMDWLDLFAVQGTLRSLLQHHSSKASILQHSAFFTVQLSHPYMTTGKTIALTRWTFVGWQSNVSAFQYAV